jgi:hypothetical protein
MKDVRYLSLLHALLKSKPDAGAARWFYTIDFKSDPASVRREAIDWIVKLHRR